MKKLKDISIFSYSGRHKRCTTNYMKKLHREYYGYHLTIFLKIMSYLVMTIPQTCLVLFQRIFSIFNPGHKSHKLRNQYTSTNLHWYKSIFTGTNQFTQVPINIHWYQSIFTGTNQFTLVPTNLHWYQSIYTGTNQYTLVPTNLHWYQPIYTGTN
jgi:hypothetical protein